MIYNILCDIVLEYIMEEKPTAFSQDEIIDEFTPEATDNLEDLVRLKILKRYTGRGGVYYTTCTERFKMLKELYSEQKEYES